MVTTRIPAAGDLRGRLNGIDRLITATKWERAAIVFAHTAVGGPRNTAHHTPPPPKLNIRTFAAQGYAGLTTPKAVARYREAWASAISHGWAVPVEPGQEVRLPDHPFPAWPSGHDTAEEDAAFQDTAWEDPAWEDPPGGGRHRSRGPNRTLPERVFGSLDRAATALRQLADAATAQPLDDEIRDQLVARLTTLRQEAEDTLNALRREPAAV